jgi:hypothetical protein
MVERSLDLSRSALGNTVADAAWRAGQAAPLAQVISEARSTNAPMVVGAPVTNEPLPTAT